MPASPGSVSTMPSGPRVGFVRTDARGPRYSPRGRPSRRWRSPRGHRGGASGNRSRWLRGDGALQISKIVDGRSAIDLPSDMNPRCGAAQAVGAAIPGSLRE
jgi:hypothetical protein